MNILFLAYNVNIHSRTGDAVHVRELALNLAALGNKVSLVVGFNPDSKEDTSSLTNNSNIDLQYVKNPKIKYPRSRDVSILSLCFNIVKNNSFDIIYERNFSCRIGVILSKILRIPLVVEINGLIDEEAEMQGRHVSLIRKMVGKRLRRLFFMKAQKIVAVTVGIKDELINSYKIPSEKIVVVANGANTNLFKPMNQKEVKAELGLDEKSKYICFVGNLAPWQGVDYLIRAAPFVLEEVPEARFLIVGDGMMREDLEIMVKKMDLQDTFVFTGSIPFEVVPKYINASSVCVAPFLGNRKCSPIKVFEYLSCSKPVIISDIGRDIELFYNSNSLFIVPPEDHVKLANAVTKILKDGHIHIIEKNKINNDDRNYSWNSTAKKVMELCENL